MNTIITKFKTSATLWSVVGAFILAMVNLIWGNDNNVSTIASAIIAIIPASIYIYQKFKLRIVFADSNNDGKISVEELAAAIKIAFEESNTELQTASDAIETIIDVISTDTNISTSKSGTTFL
ncbi:MAG: EF-hand domain-containing protein [Dysgonamonadaceae bacterium]